MKKIIPFRVTEKRRLRKLRTAKDQTPITYPISEEEGMVTVLLKDGTCETISGKNLELDLKYQDGVPYLVVRERR